MKSAAPEPGYRLLQAAPVALGLGAIYALVGLYLASRPTLLHDEGYSSFLFSRLLADAPLDLLFFQKAKPVVALLYAPFAALGPAAFFTAHVLVAASAIPLLAAAARAMGIAAPNLVAFVLLTSPLHLLGGPLGFSNTDGLVGMALVLYLLEARRLPVAAGLVLGALPWVRYELLPLIAVLWIGEALSSARRRGFLLAVPVFPALYLLAGALFHHDLLWALHHPPTLPAGMTDNPIWGSIHAHRTAGQALSTLVQVSVAVPAILLLRPRAAGTTERSLLAFGLIFLLLMNTLPLVEVLNFDYSPRYQLQVLPVAALALARLLQLEPASAERRWGGSTVVGLGLLLLVSLLCLRTDARAGPLLLTAGLCAVLALASAGFPQAAAATAALLLLVPAVAELARGSLERQNRLRPVSLLLARLEAAPESFSGRTLYTNQSLLSPYLERTGRLPALDVTYLLQPDHRHELEQLSNGENGQRARILAQVERRFFGPSTWARALDPDASTGSLLLVCDDPRLWWALPRERWERHVHWLATEEGCRLGEVVPAGSGDPL